MSLKTRRSLVAALAFLGLTSVTAVGTVVWHGRATAAALSASQRTPPVTARKGDLLLKVTAIGTVEPEYVVEIKSKASGVIKEVPVQEGDQVQKKTLLLRIDPVDETRHVTQAEADLRIAESTRASAQSKATFGEQQLRKTEQLLAKGLASSDEVETQRKELSVMRADAQSASAQVLRAREALSEAKDRLADTEIRSPIVGTVLARLVNPGMVVASGTTTVNGGTTLLQLADLSRLFVRVKVDEADVGRVAVGQPVTITADALPGKKLGGTVLRVSPQGKVDSNVTIFEVIVEVDQDARKVLRPMMTANVEITAQKREGVVLVPARALRTAKAGKAGADRFVIVDGQRRTVTTGETDGRDIEITSGLAAGERITLPETAGARGPGQGNGTGQGNRGAAGAMGAMGGMGGMNGMARGLGR
jgi:HlyD family secretion protein